MNLTRTAKLMLAAGTLAVPAVIAGAYLTFVNQTSVVILVRHAERPLNSGTNDPDLTAAGQARAQSLVHVAGSAGVAAIYHSEFRRTQQTVQPLASHLQILPEGVQASQIDQLVAAIRSRRGQVVLVAGHSDTVPRIIEKLGAGSVPPIGDGAFDNLYVVFLPRFGSSRVVRLRYGAPT